MGNISLNAEDIYLSAGKSFLVIDALYLNDIKEKISSVDKFNLSEIRKKIFPYTDTPFTIFTQGASPIFSLKQLRKITVEEQKHESLNCFSSDTGLFIFIEESLTSSFLIDYDYDELVDSENAPINITYWIKLSEKFGQENLGLILSPGIGKGVEFDGSGTYKIV